MIDSRIRCGTAGEFDEDLTSAIAFLGSAPAVAHAATAAMRRTNKPLGVLT
jgi:hypothetical protein